MLDYRIYTFIAVCEAMNYTRAAEQLHITQPAVSQHIHYLEELYHTRLFEYSGKKLQLTPAGKLLYHTTTTLKNDQTYLVDQLQSASLKKAPLIFGVTMTIGEFIVAKPLANYIHRNPDAQIRMILANTGELLEALRDGSIHFALVEGYFDSTDYDYLTYSTEKFVPVCSAAHQFSVTDTVSGRIEAVPASTGSDYTFADLTDETLLLREPGSGTRDILEKNLELKNMHTSDFRNIIEIGSMHAIIELLKNDCGISFLYKAAVAELLETRTLIEIPMKDFHMQHDFTFIWNKGSLFSATYRSICEQLRLT